MFDLFRRMIRRVVNWFRSEQGSAPPAAERLSPGRAASVADVLAAGLVPPPDQPLPSPTAPAPQGNRKQRRAADSDKRRYERERRKFDKFVEPQGELPQPQSKTETPTKRPKTIPRIDVVTLPDEPESFCVDIHHTDRKTMVLYERDEFNGEFNFRDTILDQLERYFFYLERMEKRDHDAYGFYREVGATLLPYAATPDLWTHDPDAHKGKNRPSEWFLHTRPAFGCVAYGTSPESERVEEEATAKAGRGHWIMIPRFIYFVKYSHPPYELQPMGGGDIYKVTAWWDRKVKNLKWGAPSDYGVWVGHDGKLTALKMLDTRIVQIPKHDNGMLSFSIPERGWHIPDQYISWAKTHHTNPDTLLCNIFTATVEEIERAAWSMIRVSVEKNGRHAVFSVDPQRMSYFFKDRDIELTESGRRKKIFHAVRPQKHADGVTVRMHFRGQREFTWAGYNVKIRVPGLDHGMIEEFKPGVIDSHWLKPGRKYVTEPEVGRVVREVIDTGKINKNRPREYLIQRDNKSKPQRITSFEDDDNDC